MAARVGAGSCYGLRGVGLCCAAFMLGGGEGTVSSGTRQLMQNSAEEELGLHCPGEALSTVPAKVIAGPRLGL